MDDTGLLLWQLTSHPQPQINHKNWLVHTRIRLKGNGHLLLLTMVVSACNIRFLLVFDSKLRADQRKIWSRDMANGYFWPDPRGKNPHFQMWVWKPCSDSFRACSWGPKGQIRLMWQVILSTEIILSWPNQYSDFRIVWWIGKDTAIKWSWEAFVDGGKIKGWKVGVFDCPARSWWVLQLDHIKSDFLSCKMVGCWAFYDN